MWNTTAKTVVVVVTLKLFSHQIVNLMHLPFSAWLVLSQYSPRCCCRSVAGYSLGLVIEMQWGELFDQLIQSVLLLVYNVPIVGQCSEKTFTSWNDHVPAELYYLNIHTNYLVFAYLPAKGVLAIMSTYFCFFFFSKCFSHSTSKTSLTSSTANVTYWYSLRIS